MLTRNATRLSVDRLEDRWVPANLALDLTHADAAGQIRGAIFAQFSGTKASVDTFLSMDTARGGSIEQGINTPTVQFDESGSHGVLLNDLPRVSIGGVQYVEFLLNVDESRSHPQVSLEDLLVFASAKADPGVVDWRNVSLDQKSAAYHMDGELADTFGTYPDPTDWRIELDASLNGKGKSTGSMLFYLPVSALSSSGVDNPYVYLYSRFGTVDNPADGKAESWSHGVKVNGVPAAVSPAGTLAALSLFTPPPPPPTPPSDGGSGDTGGGDTGGGDVWL